MGLPRSTWLFILIGISSVAKSIPPIESYLMSGGSTKYSTLGELISHQNMMMQADFNYCMSRPNLAGGYNCVSRKIISSSPNPIFGTVNEKSTYYNLGGEHITYSRPSSTQPEQIYTNVFPSWLGVSVQFTCAENFYPQTGGSTINKTLDCLPFYVAVIPESVPPTICQATVGNPIDTTSGAKFQQEIDITSVGLNQIEFTRTYNNANKNKGGYWYTSYQQSLRIIDPTKIETVREKSAPYASKATACTSGFNDLKAKINDDWIQGSSAQYVNNTCQVVRNNKVIRSIPIVPNANSVHITLVPGAIQLIREDGSILNYGMNSNNQHSGTSGERGRLIAVANAAPIAWRYTAPNGEVEDYNAEGKLLSITASNGMKQELFYDATSGLLSRVKDSTGRELLFAYTGNQLSSVTVDGNKTTSYAYNPLGLITIVTRPDNTTRIYHYEDSRFPTALTGITDERGKRYATWTYDAQGRAISSEHAGGAEKTLLSFNADGSTTVTNALNKQTIYRFDDIAGARRVVKVEGQPTANCAGANQNYTYTHEGWIASKTDWKGIKTTFQYNTLGQEISRTEAVGTPDARTITTEWHPTLYLKTKITEPDKQTLFTYDAQGRLTHQATQSLN